MAVPQEPIAEMGAKKTRSPGYQNPHFGGFRPSPRYVKPSPRSLSGS
jgi:hypothetical protein